MKINMQRLQEIRLPKLTNLEDVKVGDYGLASRWLDTDPLDPWAVGFVEAIQIPPKGHWAKQLVKIEGFRWFKAFRRIEKNGKESNCQRAQIRGSEIIYWMNFREKLGH